MEEERIEEVELRKYLMVIGKRKWTIITILLICFLFSMVFTFTLKPVYKIECTFEIGRTPAGLFMTPAGITQFCESDFFANNLKEILSLPSEENIAIKVRTLDYMTISLSLKSSLPREEMVKIINTAMSTIIKEYDSKYGQEIKQLSDNIAKIEKQINSIPSERDRIIYLLYLRDIKNKSDLYQEPKVVVPAAIPGKLIMPKPILSITAGVVLGFFLGFLAALFQEYFSRTGH